MALWFALTEAACAVKPTLVAPAGTVAEAGTVKLELLSEIVTEAPPAAAAALRVTVQLDVPGVLIVVGLQVNALSVAAGGVTGAVMDPPVPEMAKAVPEGSTADVFVTLMAVLEIPAAIVALTIATTPLAIVVAFNPLTTQV